MRVRVCEHMKKFEGEEFLTTSNGFRWNAWREVYDREGRLIFSGFETGAMMEYLEHLLENEECLVKTGWSREEIKEELEKINREWEEVSH